VTFDLTVEREPLAKLLQAAVRIVPTAKGAQGSPMFLLRAKGGRLLVTATDGDLTVTQALTAVLASEGSLAIPARLLTDGVGGVRGEQVRLRVDPRRQSLTLSAPGQTMRLNGLDPSEFPSGTSQTLTARADLDADSLRQAIDSVQRAAARSNEYPLLVSICLRLAPDLLTLAASDKFHLSVAEVPLPLEEGRQIELVVPVPAMREVMRLLNGVTGPVALSYSDRQVRFGWGEPVVNSTLLAGRYLAYEIVPQTAAGNDTAATVATEDLRRAARLAALVSSDEIRKVALTFRPAGGKGPVLVVASAGAGMGEQTAEVAALDPQGGDLTIHLDNAYLLDALGAIPQDQVRLTAKSTARSVVHLAPEGESRAHHYIQPLGA